MKDSDRYATKEIWYYEHRLPEGQKSYSKTKTIQVQEFDPLKAWWNNREETDQAWKVPIQTIIDRGLDLDIKNPTKKEEIASLSSDLIITKLQVSIDRSKKLIEEIIQLKN